MRWKVINSENFVPQRRERVFIVGFNDGTKFEFPELPDDLPVLKDILEEHVDPKYTISDHLWAYHQERKRKQKEKGNGFGYGLFDLKSRYTNTISARYYKDGSEILISRGKNRNPRKLTERECARLQGFPESFKFPVSDLQAYKQAGNAVPINVVEKVCLKVIQYLALNQKNLDISKKAS